MTRDGTTWGGTDGMIVSVRMILLVASGVVASSLMMGAPDSSASEPDSRLLVSGENAALSLVPPPLPPGLQWSSVAVGADSAIYLRSDGNAFTAGQDSFGSLTVPALPAGKTYTRVFAGGPVLGLIRSDGQLLISYAPDGSPVTVPPLPAGVGYARAEVNGGYVAAIRTDHRAVIFRLRTDDRSFTPPGEQPTYSMLVTSSADYADAALAPGFALLLTSRGTVRKVSLPNLCAPCTPSILRSASVVPPLPRGVRYLDVATTGASTVLTRSDGAAVISHPYTWSGQRLVIPHAPRGLVYSTVEMSDETVTLLRSDGRAVVYGHPDREGIIPSIPSVPKGWVFRLITSDASQSAFIVRTIEDSEQVPTSVTSSTHRYSARHGTKVTFKVKVFSMASTAGGTVAIKYRGKTIATGLVGPGSEAKVVVPTARLNTRGGHRLAIVFLGTQQAARSTSATRGLDSLRTY